MIIAMIPPGRVLVRFSDENAHEAIATYSNLRSGSVKNPYAPSVFGFGHIGVGQHKASMGRRDAPVYGRWKAMLQRVFCEKWKSSYPTYRDCSLDPEWLNFQSFASWVVSQHGYGLIDWEIDKDFLFSGNKHYGPPTCALIPQRINKLMTGASGTNGLPRGVSWHARYEKFGASCRDGSGRDVFLGRYLTSADAFKVYKDFKERVIQNAANEFKESLDDRVYSALMAYEVLP